MVQVDPVNLVEIGVVEKTFDVEFVGIQMESVCGQVPCGLWFQESHVLRAYDAAIDLDVDGLDAATGFGGEMQQSFFV